MVRLLARNQVLLVAKHYPNNWPLRQGWAVIVGQLLWGLLAWRRGAGWAWLQGKWEGMRLYGKARAACRRPDPAALEQLLGNCERQLARLQRRTQQDAFWRWYFRWVSRSAEDGR